ncbi:MAG TPA: DUF5700 domain-containing putative Zn-dependent protease [Gemmatimonadales bacterium]|nr:DUF5700 domain-containing putative Zn-dependent protease [Gemmatimonadales bacterium]
MRSFRSLPSLLLLLAAAPPAPPDLVIVTDEAEAALEILERRGAGRPVEEETWRRLFATEGYRRLQAREAAMGRAFDDSSFRQFLLSDTLPARASALRAALQAWRRADLGAARANALAYLPDGARIRARIYLLIKPKTNSFVFEPDTDPAIMLYLDPTRTRAQLENTIAHELHHIGYAGVCSRPDSSADPAVTEARGWLGAFGEGVAMLAAAGGPGAHPHAVSPVEDRERWDRDLANSAADLARVEAFLLDILDRRVTDADSIGRAGMAFFGVQGPWYTVGWLMASTVERDAGRRALVETLCDPVRLLRRYDSAARARPPGEPALPLWSETLLARLGGG